ncbi:MAG: hypothetical protein HOQ12_13890 [Gemmatimonadaceae bacterium]|nr:hypothetical protein [Gemmatimonadaceae bacterium]NUR20622.1 hypothetical protein [Gemmatimonadaceae bacterium]
MYLPGYRWSVSGHGLHDYWRVELAAGADSNEARSFPSLDALLATAKLTACRGGGMVATCAPLAGAARSDDGHVVVTLRDSALIAELFGLRPERRGVFRDSPVSSQLELDSVRVEYVDPQVAEPSDSLRSWVAERRRLEQKNDRRAIRAIRVAPSWGWGDTLWVALGDTVEISLAAFTCSGDVCSGNGGTDTWGDSSWVVGDSTMLAPLRPAEPLPSMTKPRSRGQLSEIEVVSHIGPRPPARRVAARVGATTIHVGGLKPYEDSAHVAAVPPRALTNLVVVRPPVSRVVIHPRPDTVFVGAEPWFMADAFDTAGGLLLHATVPITYPDSGLRARRRWFEAPTTGLPPGGRRRIVAAFRGVADTLTVFVADTVKR